MREPGSSGVSVLVVEDDAFMRRYVCDALVEAGHRVREARDGDEALEAVRAEAPRLVVLDLLMPHRSGLEVLPQLRTLCPSARVVVVSSLDTPALILQAFEAGASSFVTKPFHPSELAEAVERALGEEGGA